MTALPRTHRHTLTYTYTHTHTHTHVGNYLHLSVGRKSRRPPARPLNSLLARVQHSQTASRTVARAAKPSPPPSSSHQLASPRLAWPGLAGSSDFISHSQQTEGRSGKGRERGEGFRKGLAPARPSILSCRFGGLPPSVLCVCMLYVGVSCRGNLLSLPLSSPGPSQEEAELAGGHAGGRACVRCVP